MDRSPTVYVNNDPLKLDLMNSYEVRGGDSVYVRFGSALIEVPLTEPGYVIKYSFEIVPQS